MAMARFPGKKDLGINIVPFWQRLKFLFFAEEFFRYSFLVVVIFILFSSAFLFLKHDQLPPEVPLFYSRSWGQEQLAPALWLWLLPGMAMAISLFNWGLAAVFYKKEEKLLARFLVAMGLVIGLFSMITLFKIVMLIT